MYSSLYYYYWQYPFLSQPNFELRQDWSPYYYYYWVNYPIYNERNVQLNLQDYGKQPLVINIEEATEQNTNYRTALWTGQYFQVTLMNIDPGKDIGLEVHPTTDQFIRIEDGQGLVQMGDSQDNLDFEAMAFEDYAVMVPAGKWHNITNTGQSPLKVYVIYAPPEHPFGTVQQTSSSRQLQQ